MRNSVAVMFTWPRALIATAAASLLLFAVGIASPFRTVIVVFFLLVGPGMAAVRRIGLSSRPLELMLAVALSLAMDETISLLLMYLRIWSPGRCLLVLAIGTVAAALWPVRPATSGSGT